MNLIHASSLEQIQQSLLSAVLLSEVSVTSILLESSGRKRFFLLTNLQKVNSSQTLSPGACATCLTSSPHVGFLSSHIIITKGEYI